MQTVKEFIAENRENILRDMARLVAVPSVKGPALPGAPYGEGPRNALNEGLAMAREMGFETYDAQGYLGWAQLPGKDPEKYIATITHMDVVPVGNGWDADPWILREKDGWLLGRGIADDKGPSVLILYALKYIKESGMELKYPIRAIFGCDEECGMTDVEYYQANYPAPAFLFTPDAEFPLCNGEKGHFGGKICSPVCNGVILDFEGGVANNAVPDRAKAIVKVPLDKLKKTAGITLEAVDENTTAVLGQGKSGHAALPEGTVNAIGLVVDCLLESGVCNEAENAYLKVLQKLHEDYYGRGVGIQADDGKFTPLTIIGGVISMKDGVISQTFDCRYVTTTDVDTLTRQMEAACGTAAHLEEVEGNACFYIEPDHPAIQALLNTYNEVTGRQAQPFLMGGGTYARHFPCAVSYGPEVQDLVLPDFAGPMHGANEGARFEDLLMGLEIYINALLRLEELEL